MTDTPHTERRTVLKIAGASIAGSVAMSSTVSADGKQLPRTAPDGRLIYATWGDDEIWEIFDAEPPERWRDSEGNHHAHEPLYLINGLPTSVDEHSPHIEAPDAAPIDGFDHVAPVPGGTDKPYSAQWHPKAVVDPDRKWLVQPSEENPGFPNFVNQDADGNYLTSSAKVEAALADGDVDLIVTPEEAVFTCPIRPHGNGGGHH